MHSSTYYLPAGVSICGRTSAVDRFTCRTESANEIFISYTLSCVENFLHAHLLMLIGIH